MWDGNVFIPVCDSVQGGGGGGSLSRGGLCLGVSMQEGLCRGGVSVQGAGVSVQLGLCDRDPSRTVEEREVRILLECILLYFRNS